MHFVFSLVLPMCIILIACALFTRTIENLGAILKVGDSVVGSIFAAVGTCLPETLIPVIAVWQMLFGGKDVEVGSETAMGAILGAPFMLATVAFPLMAISVIAFSRRRCKNRVEVDVTSAKRDIVFFCMAIVWISIVSAVSMTDYFLFGIRIVGGMILCTLYFVYVLRTIKEGRISVEYAGTSVDEDLSQIGFARRMIVFVLLLISLAGIIFGAKAFVNGIEEVSEMIGVSPLILSMIVAPVATELPEKLNSIIWVGKEEDTLAFGNITGAMVFQSCIPASIGIVFTKWEVDVVTLYILFSTFITALIVYINLTCTKKRGLTVTCLIFPIIFYAIYVGYVILFLQ